MGSFNTFIDIVKNNREDFGAAVLLKLSTKQLLNWMSDEAFLKLRYRVIFHKKLDFKSPKTFNEKLQWMKLYDRNPDYIKLVDKYAVREYIAEKIGEEYLIPLLGVWDSPEEIDYDSLPEQFVLKCNHDSGSVIICRDKSAFDKEAANKKLKYHLGRNLYNWGREWPYKHVKPRVIAEKFLSELSGDVPDYKIFCFGGIPKVILLCADRFTEGGLRENFYDTDWNLLPVRRPLHPNTDYEVKKPGTLDEMLKLAKVLSEGKTFSRIDFYDVNGKVYFGEITFFPASGLESFEPDEWDLKLGEWIELPEKNQNTEL